MQMHRKPKKHYKTLKILTRLAEKQKISFEEAEQIFNRVKFCTELKDLKDSDLVIEAIIENKEIKTKVFSELETYVSGTCIIGSNTSSISIFIIGAEKSESLHRYSLFNPAPLMPLVEVIPGLLTDEQLPQKFMI